LVLATIWYTWTLYGKKASLDGEPEGMPWLKRLVAKRWMLDELYAFLFEKPYAWLSRNLFGTGEVRLAVPLTAGMGKAAMGLSELVRKVQTGRTGSYLFLMMASVVLFLLILWSGM
jgi:NADH-quinone oxidoreductase subunit L